MIQYGNLPSNPTLSLEYRCAQAIKNLNLLVVSGLRV